jgi:ubiquinone/menaquinone biosynthesis C-methylase UbiE
MEHVDSIQSFYGRWARIYDILSTAPGVAVWRQRSADALTLDPGDTVVEMGCGTGANLPYLRDRVGPRGTVVGIDVTRELLARARSRADREGWSNVHLIQADAMRPPAGTAEAVAAAVDTIDAILGTFVVGMFPDPAAVVADWCELCRPGARIALLNFQRSHRLLARPLNIAFEGFVCLSSPGWERPTEPPGASFQRRIDAAREMLADRTVGRQYEAFAGGYVGLVSGRVPSTE